MTLRSNRVAAALMLVGFLLVSVSAEMKQPMLGEDAPDFDLPSVKDKSVPLKSLHGKFVVIHFAASW
jgi:peroxiredoxin